MPHRYHRLGLVRRTRMHRTMSALTIILCLPFQTLCSAIPLKATAVSPIIIEEVAWAGSSISIADEWIELANLSDATTTIAGWTLKGAGTSGRDIVVPEDAEIPPNGTYLIANYTESDEKSALINSVRLATSTISLSNSQLKIELFDANQNLIDQAGDESAPFAGSSNTFSSMIRTDVLVIGDQKTAWTSATTSIGFKQGIADFGTPGFCDLCEVVGIRDTGVRGDLSTATDTDQTVSSTTLITSENVIYSTSSSNSNSQTSSILATADTNQTTSTPSPYIPPPTPHPLLNEIVSNPSSGSEWIELLFPEGTTSTNQDLFLYDGQGKIFTITSSTLLTASPYLLIQLPSSKLNNSGDKLSVRTIDGTILDQTSIPSLEKGQSWAQNPEGDAWAITDTLTPASENIIYRTPSSNNNSNNNSNSNSNSNSQTSSMLTTTPVKQTTSTSPPYTPPPTPYPLHLNEIVSNPSSGPEWVELYIPSDATSTDRILILRDSKTAIKTIPALTPLTLPHYLVVALTGSKLTNAGEVISLTEASGTLIEATTIPKLAKGYAWAKTDDGSWEISEILTPASSNQFSLSSKESTVNQTKTTSSSLMETESTDDLLDEIFSSAEESNQTIKSSSSVVKKSTTSKVSDLVTPYNFTDMFDETLNGVRARVTGTVASIPKLFGASHVFILQNEDGRGMIIYVPAHLHIPSYGSTVRVDGTLSATNYGPQLRMKKTDIWMSMATSTSPQPRPVDLLAPSGEDAWSLISIQGTVSTIGTTSFTIETEDAMTITISTPTIVGFRTKRLVKGDTIQAIGLLNIKKLTPTIIIRTPEDITLVKHAPDTVTISSSTSTTVQTKNRFPDWVPFASAGVAIVGTGGAKRLREIMRKRTLKKLMEKAKE